MTRRKRIALLVIVPLALALHAYLIWLGGPWRVFALVEAGFGIFLALIIRDAKRLGSASEASQSQIANHKSDITGP